VPDTLAAMALNGVCFTCWPPPSTHAGPNCGRRCQTLFTISPFAVLQPLDISSAPASIPAIRLIYLALALSIALVSQRHQRRAFYYAGVLNAGGART
jgi:hypothetical protein